MSSMFNDDKNQLATLERAFVALGWAWIDAKHAGGDWESIYEAQRSVGAEIHRRFPEQWQDTAHRLLARAQAFQKMGLANTPGVMRPRVVNRHHFRGDDGEPNYDLLPTPWIYIGRRTPLGNPYTKKDHGSKALTFYNNWLREKIKARDKDVLKVFSTIEWDTNLVCSCAPSPCHGDTVVVCWEWLQRQPWWDPEDYRG